MHFVGYFQFFLGMGGGGEWVLALCHGSVLVKSYFTVIRGLE